MDATTGEAGASRLRVSLSSSRCSVAYPIGSVGRRRPVADLLLNLRPAQLGSARARLERLGSSGLDQLDAGGPAAQRRPSRKEAGMHQRSDHHFRAVTPDESVRRGG